MNPTVAFLNTTSADALVLFALHLGVASHVPVGGVVIVDRCSNLEGRTHQAKRIRLAIAGSALSEHVREDDWMPIFPGGVFLTATLDDASLVHPVFEGVEPDLDVLLSA